MSALLLAQNLSEVLTEAMNPESVNIGGIEITTSLISAVIVTVFLLIMCLIVRFVCLPRFKDVPKGFQALLEWVVDFFDGIAKENSPLARKSVSPYIVTCGVFIFFGTMIEMLGLRPVFADINSCLALALCTFFLINYFGVRKNGPIGRITSYFRTSGIAAPFRMLSDLITPVSLTLRLYGSILSGFLIMEMIYAVVAIIVPIPLSLVFTVFHAVIQAYIFSLLSSLFIGEAME
ncbi:MAG: FoF1 ATP synthase subunit a [Christensenellales bacterium]